MTTQPNALWLANMLDAQNETESVEAQAAAELRRLHAENEELSRALSLQAGVMRKLMAEHEALIAKGGA